MNLIILFKKLGNKTYKNILNYWHKIKSKNLEITLIGLSILFIFILFNNRSSSHYQAAGCGERTVIIDQNSGEAWITDTYKKPLSFGDETIFYLKPMGYCDPQRNDYRYKPDEQRNNKNTTWLIWLKRIFHLG